LFPVIRLDRSSSLVHLIAYQWSPQPLPGNRIAGVPRYNGRTLKQFVGRERIRSFFIEN